MLWVVFIPGISSINYRAFFQQEKKYGLHYMQ